MGPRDYLDSKDMSNSMDREGIPDISFIEATGSELEKARIRWILFGEKPGQNIVEQLAELQNENGGFPYDMVKGNLSTVDNTLVGLLWMHELGLFNSRLADRAMSYILAVQKQDGGWDEDPAISQYGLPPWIRIGDTTSRLYLSSYAAYWLALGNYTTSTAFEKALAFIIKHQDETGKFQGYLHTTWIAASVLFMAGSKYRERAEKALQFLEERPLSEWADSQIAWALDCLNNAGLPKDHPFVKAGLNELTHRRRSDGSWASEDGASFDVGATISAMKTLKRYGLL